MTARSQDDLVRIAKTIRRHIITSTTTAGSGHPTSSMSGVELAVTLYFGGFLRHDPKNAFWPQRDRFILSKGHAAPLLYACLAEAGYYSTDRLPTLRKLGSPLEGHPNYERMQREKLGGVEASTGSLGQGLSIGLGHALALKLEGYDSRVFVMLGDGEIDQGQVWEAAMAAAKYRADNLIAIIDQNGYQQTGPTSEVLDLRPVAPKFAAFGWHAQEIDGHNLGEIRTALTEALACKGQPSAIVARTQKGYPIQHLLASDPNHHGKPLTAAEAQAALEYIDQQ